MNETRSWDELSRHYHDEVISPFAPGVRFPLRSDLRARVTGWKRDGVAGDRVVLDCGCGIGEALVEVAGQVGLAAGIDFSEGMLTESEARLSTLGIEAHLRMGERALSALRQALEALESGSRRTFLVRGDLNRLGAVAARAHLTLAINSIVPATEPEARHMFQEVAATVRPEGELIAVFPSRDSLVYLRGLFEESGDDFGSVGSLEEKTGEFRNCEGELQWFLSEEEIRRYCDEAELIPERLEKIEYPWRMLRESGWGYFPGQPEVWDWYLVARR